MPRIKTNAITIEYETFGSAKNEAILLIAGAGAQLTQWPVELCKKLAKRGYRVIRFDNRDAGYSSKVSPEKILSYADALAALTEGKSDFVSYTLSDMASDAVGLLDALKIEKAHIAGAAMGGMIAQTIAVEHPARVLSLTSIMSTTGNPDLPPANEDVQRLLLATAPMASDIERIVARDLELSRLIGSPDYKTDEAVLREWALRDALRSYYPIGTLRQMAAVIASGDRREALATIKAPTVVLHGGADIYVPVAAGEDTAKVIPDAQLRVIAGMGHDLPVALAGQIVEAIVAAAERATGPKVADQPGSSSRDSGSGQSGFFANLFRRFRREPVPV